AELVRSDADPHRHLRRQVHGALWHRPRPDAVLGPGRVTDGLQRVAGADEGHCGQRHRPDVHDLHGRWGVHVCGHQDRSEEPLVTLVEPTAQRLRPRRVTVSPGSRFVRWITTTDHKTIGHLYLVTSFVFFIIAGIMAELMRTELARPGLQFLTPEQYNQLFTMHGTLMLLMFATPLFVGFANEIMPLQIGSPDVAFPRLNMLSYWFFLFGSLIVLGGALTPGGWADFGWYAYSPLTDAVHSPGAGADMWIMGLALSGFGTILGAVNFITTILCMRAPG